MTTNNNYGDLIFNEMLENDVYKMRLSIGRGGGGRGESETVRHFKHKRN